MIVISIIENLYRPIYSLLNYSCIQDKQTGQFLILGVDVRVHDKDKRYRFLTLPAHSLA